MIQNDLGHPGTSATDWSFAVKPPGQPNTDAIIDFGHRATHTATVAGKDLVSRFYKRPAQHSYWQGCSTGGRQGLAEVQRYPADYDGVIAGAPVYSPLVYSNAILRVQAFHAKPESNLLPAHVPLIQKAVLAACDMKDGVADGILTDPRACTWDPGELACKGDSRASADCLTAPQVETVRRAYAGVKTKDGRYAAMPLMRGGESDWVARMVGTPQAPRGVNAVLGAPFVSHLVLANPSYDIMTFDPERDMAALNRGLAAEHVHQQNPDISAFIGRGGKLLLWHGFNDPGPSPLSTIEYFDAVNAKVPAAKRRGASLPRARRAALPRRRRSGSLRRADRARELGRERHAAGVDAGDQGELAAVAAALSVSTAAALQGIRRHQRRRQLRLRRALTRVSSREAGIASLLHRGRAMAASGRPGCASSGRRES